VVSTNMSGGKGKELDEENPNHDETVPLTGQKVVTD
jgi:hypothetical protein